MLNRVDPTGIAVPEGDAVASAEVNTTVGTLSTKPACRPDIKIAVPFS